MARWKTEQVELAESILGSQLAASRDAFYPEIAGVDAAAQGHGRYGGSDWHALRISTGKAELRKRAGTIRVAWRRVLDVQSRRRAKRLRPVAANLAVKRFRDESRQVIDLAIPKPGSRFLGGDPHSLDATVEETAGELRADLLLPPTTPGETWLVRLLQEQSGNAIALVIGAVVGALIARAEDVWSWIRKVLSTL